MSIGDVASNANRNDTSGGALSDRLSLGVAARLSRYLQVLTQARKMGKETISSQELADRLVEAGVKIIFNYSDALVQVPPDVTVHTSSPAVDLLYALYVYLT